MFETIIFDLDGPILDGKLRHYQCYVDGLKQLNFLPLAVEEYWQLKRSKISLQELLQLSQAQNKDKDFLQFWLENIEDKKYLELDCLQREILEVLSELNLRGISLLLVTLRNHKENLNWQLNKLGLAAFFQHIITVNNGEDKAIVVEKVISKKNKEKILWIGDTEVDITAARVLRIKVCAVSCGLRDEKFLKTLQPDFLVKDVYDFNRSSLKEYKKVM